MPFIRGADPFHGLSQQPIDLLQAITPLEIASCVPLVRIQKIDRFGRPDASVRPVTFDLIEGPQLGSPDGFGLAADQFVERSLVSLNSLRVEFQEQYGLIYFREVTLDFTVHKPAAVLDRDSQVPWRQILQPGETFSLEYGWVADPSIVSNPLFNGQGMVTDSGLVVKSTQSVLLQIYTYEPRVAKDGEVTVTVKAMENGELAFRNALFSDVFRTSFSARLADKLQGTPDDDVDNVTAVRGLLDSVETVSVKDRGDMYRMGSLLDAVVAPLVETASRAFGYSGSGRSQTVAGTSVPGGTAAVMMLGRFNQDAGRQSDRYGSRDVGGLDIGEFLLPTKVLNDLLSGHFSKGRTLTLMNFITMLMETMNAAAAWASPSPGTDVRKPELVLKTDTLRNPDGSLRLVAFIYDVKRGTQPFHEQSDRLALDRQSQAQVRAKLRALDVPVLDFAHVGSVVLDASFELQPDTMLQGIMIDHAYRDQKDRVMQADATDVQSRKGQSRRGELVLPLSILQGEVTFYGNFVTDVFALLWIDFFGSPEISGVFHCNGRVDSIEPGKFTTQLKFVSEGNDPLNTRRKLTDQELAGADVTTGG